MKQTIVAILRRLHLLGVAEQFRFLWMWLRTYPGNRRFRKAHPELRFPPAHLLHEISGFVNYKNHFEGGRAAAENIHRLVSPHLQGKDWTIAEWGCGVG